jgi:hypothetical protein
MRWGNEQSGRSCALLGLQNWIGDRVSIQSMDMDKNKLLERTQRFK